MNGRMVDGRKVSEAATGNQAVEDDLALIVGEQVSIGSALGLVAHYAAASASWSACMASSIMPAIAMPSSPAPWTRPRTFSRASIALR